MIKDSKTSSENKLRDILESGEKGRENKENIRSKNAGSSYKQYTQRPKKGYKGYNKYGRKYSQAKKNKIALKAFELYGMGRTFDEMSREIGIPKATIHGIISSDERFELYKKEKSKEIQTLFLDSIRKDLERQEKIRSKASYGNLTQSIGVKWDKLHPPQGQTIHVGDKNLDVIMPEFFKPRRS